MIRMNKALLNQTMLTGEYVKLLIFFYICLSDLWDHQEKKVILSREKREKGKQERRKTKGKEMEKKQKKKKKQRKLNWTRNLMLTEKWKVWILTYIEFK